uniref:Leukocyte receptor cluster member 8 homolog n=1 Tax=Rhizophora mucronata TaxID=61149 RepID=A0A2P2JYW0_RHIMU
MMNQGLNTQTITTVDSNSFESGYTIDASQGQTTSYFSSTNGLEVGTWPIHKVDDHSAENGSLSNSTHDHGQQTVPPTRNLHDGVSATATAITNSSTYGAAYASQDYPNCMSYSNATDPYSYGSTAYTSYYGGYQQQPTHSYSQQQANHAYPQQQANHSYPQQQAEHSYSQPVGAYQNTGAPYQPLSSFQNTGSYAGTASYSTTYYNPGDYQTAGGYPSSGYSHQTNSWNEGNFTNYATNHHPNYYSGVASTYGTGTAAATSIDYQQHYRQWADYYSQTEVSCAPGTEHLFVTSTSNQGSAVPGVTGANAAPNGQLPQSITSSRKPEPPSAEVPSLQAGAATSSAQDSYWKHVASNFQHQNASPMQSNLQKSLDLKTSYDNFQEQQKIAPQGPNSQCPTAHQVPQSYQPPLQTVPLLDTRRVSKLQIPTNPRIASNLPLGLSKSDKDGSTAGTTAKPAYISVSVPKPNEKVLSEDADDPVHKPGMFPKSLQAFCERAFARCKDDTQMLTASKAVLKEIIAKAKADGTLYTCDWDTEPLFPLPNADVVNKENLQSSTPPSSLPKFNKSPGRRSKSRWEPLPEEKPVDKLASVGIVAAKYGSWDKKTFSGNSESKDNSLNNVKFLTPDQRVQSKGALRPVKRQRLADGLNATDNGDASSDSDKEQSLAAYYTGVIALANSPEEKKRRESRSRRFERGQGHRPEINSFRPKNSGAGNLYGRRAVALMLSKNFDDGVSRAVEDIDWDSLTVKGTCQEIEKRYLRLTSAPDPATVRPEDVLEKALLMVQNSQKNYLYKCDQLKSIRQDLTVQRICNQLTVKVYETHARFALEAGDLPEYNQCQSQLKTLYAEGIEGCHLEFAAYNLLCVILHSSNNRDLLSSMSRLVTVVE